MCQVDGMDMDDFSDYENVNIFNFYGPIYGDIYGFVDGVLCENGDKEACPDDEEDGPKPAVSLTGHTFTDADD